VSRFLEALETAASTTGLGGSVLDTR
jgi:hypothetical protein